MTTNNLIRVEFANNTWAIVDPTTNNRIPVEQVLMDADTSGPDFAEGLVLSVHGIDQEIVQTLPGLLQRALGVGYPKRLGRTPNGARRVRCMAGNRFPQKA